MSRQRRVHNKIMAREYTYKVGRRLADKFNYKHKPRWRKTCGAANRSTRQTVYCMFGPAFVGAERRS